MNNPALLTAFLLAVTGATVLMAVSILRDLVNTICNTWITVAELQARPKIKKPDSLRKIGLDWQEAQAAVAEEEKLSQKLRTTPSPPPKKPNYAG